AVALATALALVAPGPEGVFRLPGEIRAEPRRVQEVRPRFAGVVREVRKSAGQSVRRGELLAIIERHGSAMRDSLTAKVAGRVLVRAATTDQNVTPETMLYTIGDLSVVWAELTIPVSAAGRMRAGQRARVAARNDDRHAQGGVVSWIGRTPGAEPRAAT